MRWQLLPVRLLPALERVDPTGAPQGALFRGAHRLVLSDGSSEHKLGDIIDGLLSERRDLAAEIDQDERLMQTLINYIILIVVISLLLLIVLFRSLLIPLIATLGYLSSVGASFGASVAVFQWGWLDPLIPAPQDDPMLSLLPLILVGVLFGLAMDYQVFLVSRIQEMHNRGMDPKAAIREGFARSGPVLVAAASIMIVVFAGFATSTFAVGASVAFGLMVGVAADAFIVHMTPMPALLSLLGRRLGGCPAGSPASFPTWMPRVKVSTKRRRRSRSERQCSRADDPTRGRAHRLCGGPCSCVTGVHPIRAR